MKEGMGRISTESVYLKVDPIKKLSTVYSELNGALAKLARFILENSSGIYTLTITELAEQSGVSESTIVRLCRTLGYAGYKDFCLALAYSSNASSSYGLLGIDMAHDIGESDDIAAIVQKVVQLNIDVVVKLTETVDPAMLEKAAQGMAKCRMLHIYGVGSSAGVALDACQRFMRAGVVSTPIADSHLQILSALQLTKDDVALGISYSGQSIETIDALRAARSVGATTICMTTFPNAPITKFSDIHLISPVASIPIPRETIASRVAQLVLVDILCVLILKTNGSEGLEERSKALGRFLGSKRYK